jgi:hypothetical protein
MQAPGELYECLGSSARSADSVRGCPRDRPSGCRRSRTYGGQRRRYECHHGVFTQVRAACWGRQESTVKPSASPTQVRTLDLHPPTKTAPGLRKRGPAAVSFLSRHVSGHVTMRRCVAVVTDKWRTASRQSKRCAEPLTLPAWTGSAARRCYRVRSCNCRPLGGWRINAPGARCRGDPCL